MGWVVCAMGCEMSDHEQLRDKSNARMTLENWEYNCFIGWWFLSNICIL